MFYEAVAHALPINLTLIFSHSVISRKVHLHKPIFRVKASHLLLVLQKLGVCAIQEMSGGPMVVFCVTWKVRILLDFVTISL